MYFLILRIIKGWIKIVNHYFLCSLKDVYPALFEHYDDHGHLVEAITEGKQAVNQLIASAVTFIIAIVGGGLTGSLLCNKIYYPITI